MKKLLLINLLMIFCFACRTTHNTSMNKAKVADTKVAKLLPDYCILGEKYVPIAQEKYNKEIRPKTVFIHDFGLPDTTMKRLKKEGYRFASSHSTLHPIQSDSISWVQGYISDNTYKEYFSLLKDSLRNATHKDYEAKELNEIIVMRIRNKHCSWNK